MVCHWLFIWFLRKKNVVFDSNQNASYFLTVNETKLNGCEWNDGTKIDNRLEMNEREEKIAFNFICSVDGGISNSKLN